MLAEIALAAALSSPTPPPNFAAEARAAITAKMQAVSDADAAARAKVRAHRFLWNSVNAAQNIVQTVVDCNITRKNLVAGGRENDKLIPRQVIEQITTRKSVGLCHLGGWAASIAGLAVDHYWDPKISATWTLGEWLNISSTR